ncbi:MAG: superoxide dismutase family protein [Pseudomonadota bacterium]
MIRVAASLSTFVIVMLAGCGGDSPQPVAESQVAAAAPDTSVPAVEMLAADVRGVNGLTGVVVLVAGEGKLLLGGALDNVAPGDHAIHVHETGDCSADDFTSAGPHFAPEKRPHGGPAAPIAQRHAGDFGNFTASGFGQGKFGIVKTSDRALGEFIGRAVIVHANPDDLTTQPTGAAGPRIACGVLEPAPY